MLDLGKIIPRWEWRAFAPSFADLRGKVGEVADQGLRTSQEIYIMSRAVDRNAKIRDGIFDVKLLRQVNAQKLEQWEPIFKAKFPLGAPDVVRAWSCWSLPAPKLSRSSYDVEAFLQDLVKSQGLLRAVAVSKVRSGFAYMGCAAEFATVSGQGFALETFSLEHENPQLVVAAVEGLGLDPNANTNYPRALHRALGLSVL